VITICQYDNLYNILILGFKNFEFKYHYFFSNKIIIKMYTQIDLCEEENQPTSSFDKHL